MTNTVTFVSPGATINLNHRLHWAVRARRTATWREAAWAAALEQLGRSPAQRRRDPSMVRVSFPVAQRRGRDPHNWISTVKPIVDGLVDAGVWPDDTDNWVVVLDPRFHPVSECAEVRVDLIPRAETA